MKKQIKVFMMMAMLALLLVISGKDVQAVETITASNVSTEETGANVPSYSYNISANTDGMQVIPIQVTQAGMLFIESNVVTESSYITRMAFEITSDNKIGDSSWYAKLPNSNNSFTGKTYVSTPGKYGLGIMLEDKNAAADIQVKAYVKPITTSGTLTNNQEASGYGADGIPPVYYQITIPSSGIVKVNVNPTTDKNISVEICDKNKKEIDLSNSYEKENYFGLTKGTYYIKLDCDGAYKISYSFTKVGEKKNYTSKKAVTLKKGKKATGLFSLKNHEKYSRWYKITVPKNKTVKIEITRKGNLESNSNLYVYKKIGKKVSKDWEWFGSLKDNKKKNTAKVKLKKGTYYLELTGYSVGTSYTIKWK